jgi:hypothetical protein
MTRHSGPPDCKEKVSKERQTSGFLGSLSNPGAENVNQPSTLCPVSRLNRDKAYYFAVLLIFKVIFVTININSVQGMRAIYALCR